MSADSKTVDVLEMLLQQSGSNPAVAAGDVVVTYGELISFATQIASEVIEKTAEPCPRILIALEPSYSAFAAMIASLMVGGTFCPIDVAGAAERNAAICKAFHPEIVIHGGQPSTVLDALPLTTHLVDVSRLKAGGSVADVTEFCEVAYVIFTSGSTGTPKGVKIGRRSFSHFIGVAQKYFKITTGEKWAQWSNLGHDLGVMDVFMALAHGGTLVPLSSAERLRPATAIKRHSISVWQSVPSVLELMKRERRLDAEHLGTLRIMSFCGEPVFQHQLSELFSAHPGLQVFNTYGATETIGFNTLNHLTSANYVESCDAGSVAIGTDVDGWTLLLRGGESADEGEIVMASNYLSLGYWHDEDRTKAAFRQLRMSDSSEIRCYFTGDRGVRKDSHVYCRGRNDRQVKICGERIELDEVDFRLRQVGFGNAYTIFRENELYSFVETNEPVDEERTRNVLLSFLPFHAVPKSIRGMPLLPRNQNGKIDRKALWREIG